MDKWKDKDNDYQENEYSDNSFDSDSDSDEDSEEEEERLITKLDDELIEMFSDARIITKKSFKTKKKKDKIIYITGDAVKANGRKGNILYGPYEVDGKQMYEVEIDGNGVISAEEKNIEKI